MENNTSKLKIALDNMLGEDFAVFRIIDKWETVTYPSLPSKIYLYDGRRVIKKPLLRYPSGVAFFMINRKMYSLKDGKETKHFFVPVWYEKFMSNKSSNDKLTPTIEESLIMESLEKQFNQLLTQLGLL